jgi:hypothetical protein
MACGARLPLSERKRFAASKAASRLAPQCVRMSQLHEDFTTDGTGIFNAKAQGRKGAKNFVRFCLSAPLRLCVKTSILSVKSLKSVVQVLSSHLCRARPIPWPFQARADRSGQRSVHPSTNPCRFTGDSIATLWRAPLRGFIPAGKRWSVKAIIKVNKG